jgi:hypothetical protein
LCRAALSRATSTNAKRGSSPPSRSSSRVRPTGKSSERSSWCLLDDKSDSAGRLLPGTSHAIGKHDRGRSSAPASHPRSCQSRTRRRSPQRLDGRTTPRVPRLAICETDVANGPRPAFVSARERPAFGWRLAPRSAVSASVRPRFFSPHARAWVRAADAVGWTPGQGLPRGAILPLRAGPLLVTIAGRGLSGEQAEDKRRPPLRRPRRTLRPSIGVRECRMVAVARAASSRWGDGSPTGGRLD